MAVRIVSAYLALLLLAVMFLWLAVEFNRQQIRHYECRKAGGAIAHDICIVEAQHEFP